MLKQKWLATGICMVLITFQLGGFVSKQVQAETSQQKLVTAKISPNIHPTNGKRVTVIVEMKDLPLLTYQDLVKKKIISSVGASTYLQKLKQKQQSLVKQIKKLSPKSEVKYTYDTVFAGMSLTIDGEDLKKIAADPNVSRIEPIRNYTTEPSRKKDTTITGDIRSNMGIDPLWTGKGIKVAVLDYGVDATHPDLKGSVVGGYDFIDNDKTPQDDVGHGTHVTGIIAAHGKVKGVAPDASILAYRVLGEYGGSTDVILKAVDQAVKDGAQVMNLSLGSNTNIPDDPLTRALAKVIKKGIPVVVAAGNSGPELWTLGTPGAADDVITVGSATKVAPAPTVTVQGKIEPMELNAISYSPAFPMEGNYEIVDIGKGSPESFTDDLAGKVVLVERTDNDVTDLSFYARQKNVRAVIVYNNQEGDWFANLNVSDFDPENEFASIATLAGGYGKELKKQIKAGIKNIQFGTINREKMSDSSSRGPSQGSWKIKPDVVAPGVDIVSTVPKQVDPSGYMQMTGTSMASPYVAGTVALLRQKHPNWTPDEIKSALSQTAVKLKDTEKKHYPYLVQGAGRVNLTKAVQTQVLSVPNQLAYGFVDAKTGVQTLKQSIQLNNQSKLPQLVNMKVVMEQGKESIKVNMKKSIQIAPQSQIQLPVSLSIDTNKLPKGIYSGKVLFQSNLQRWEIPIMVLLDPEGYYYIDGFFISEWAISPNGDHKQDEAVISYYLPVSIEQMTIEAIDGWNNRKFTIYDGKNITPGSKEWVWKGKDIHGKQMPDARYEINVVVKRNHKKAELDWFINVDITPPKVQLDKPGKSPALKGKITDLEIDALRWKRVGDKNWQDLDFHYVDGEGFKTTFNYVFKKNELKKGKNQIVLQAEDSAANVTTKKLEIVIP
ncbi:S8 family serine peptidase [Shimazuella kribbensis]|uniref:S8 family serine peptidase n=1 Tax=Shimazuella kribbensis TaxID=139808 RepID=UPI00042292EE|nr:S8 family serine peptidase [Shimazuella kribbensis]